MYSVVGSLGAHVLFTLGAGSFLLNINDTVVPPKIFKLEFVQRKAPPPVKKEKIRKEVVRQEIKVAMLKPKAVTVMQPKTAVRQTRETRPVVPVPNTPKQIQVPKVPVVQSGVIRSSRTVTIRAVTNTPMARSILPVTHSQNTATRTTVHKATARAIRSLPSAFKSSAPAKTTLGTEAVKMAMVQGTRHSTSPNLPKRVARSFSTSPSKGTRGRAALIQRSASIAKIPKAAPKAIDNSENDGPPGDQRVAIFQRSASIAKIPKAAPRVIGNSGNSGTSGSQRVVPRITGIQLASLTFPNPRGIPNIIDKGALKGYIGRVKRSIEGAKRYPEVSRKAGREGKLKIQFTILKNGEVTDIKLLTKSPYENLNQEAMAAVNRAAPFSGFPETMLEKSLQVILPFKFELN